MKWAEVAIYNSKPRFEALSKYLQEIGVENSVDFVETTPAGFEDVLKENLNKYLLLRIGRGLGHFVVNQFENLTATVDQLKAADTLVQLNGKWWLRSSLFHGLQRCFAEVGSRFDLESSSLIVGAGPGARVAAAALIQIGYREINFSNKFEDQAKELVNELKRTYFDVSFNFIPKDQLISLAGTNGVLVNTTPNVAENDMLTELYYLNFLKRPGIVIDLELDPHPTPLIYEAQEIGAHVVSGCQVASWADQVWAEWCFKSKFNRQDYLKKLENYFAKES